MIRAKISSTEEAPGVDKRASDYWKNFRSLTFLIKALAQIKETQKKSLEIAEQRGSRCVKGLSYGAIRK